MSTLTPLTLATSCTAHLNPFHRTCTAFRGSGLVGSALLCPMPVKGSTGISWMSLCFFRWRPSPSPPGFRGCRLGFVKAKSCICYCALCSSPPLGFCQRQYFPFAAPGHTAVRRFMLHFSMGGGQEADHTKYQQLQCGKWCKSKSCIFKAKVMMTNIDKSGLKGRMCKMEE